MIACFFPFESKSLIKQFFPDVKQEKTAQSLFAGIAAFDSTKLNHAETQEKNILPDKDGKFRF